MGRARDPVSVDYSATAARALGRAYAREGQWVTIRIQRATARRFISYYERGIDLLGGDGNDPPVNRAVRGMIRALYYEHRGNKLKLVWRGGQQTLQGWEIQIMTARYGDKRLPPRKGQFVSPVGSGTTADPALRDWS